MNKPSATFSLDELVTFSLPDGQGYAGAIRTALSQTAKDLQLGLERVTSEQAATLLCQTMGHLRRSPDTRAAALALSMDVHPHFRDRTAISVMRCRLLLQLRDPQDALAEANRLPGLRPALAARNERIRQVIAEAKPQTRSLQRRPPQDVEWAPPQQTLVETVRGLNAEHVSRKISPGLVNYLLKLREMSSDHTQELKDELTWGFAVGDYCHYLMSLNARRLDPDDPLSVVSKTMFDRDDAAALLKLRHLTEARRGVVVLQSHAGRRGLISRMLGSLDYPISFVGRVCRPCEVERGDFNFSTVAPNMTLEFLKLVKLHRKEPRITRIFPDGHDGSEQRQIDLFGRSCSVAMGASTLAWYGKAVLVFAKTHWTGDGWRVDLEMGPDFATYSDKEAADAAFVEFYADSLRKILLGPLRDFGGPGGFLAELIRIIR